MNFDEKNIILRFGALSDIHQNNDPEWPNENKLHGAFKRLNKISGNNLDLILIGGDLTDYGRPTDIDPFIRAVDKNVKPGTPVLFTLGNHDILHEPLMDYSFTYGEKNLYFDRLKDRCYLQDLDMERAFCGSRHIKCKGFHFLAVHAQNYSFDNLVTAPKQELDWLRKNLEEISREDSSKPIFITTHPVMRNTNYDKFPNYGNFWASEDIDDIIKDYPQAVVFTGHIHQLLNDERVIFQGSYTTISMPSLLYFVIPGYYIENGYNFFSDFREPSQFMYCEVDKNNVIRIKRLDLQFEEPLKNDWIIQPFGSDEFLKQYSFERYEKAPAPYFETKAELEIKNRNSDKMTLIFDSAKDKYGIQSYEVSIKNLTRDQQIYTFSTVASYYRKNAFTYMNEKHKTECRGLLEECEYEIKITAVNFFEKKSEALTFII